MPEITDLLLQRLRYLVATEENDGQQCEDVATNYYDAAERQSELSTQARERADTYRTLLMIAEALAAADGNEPTPDLAIEDGRIVEVGHHCPAILRLTPAQARAMAAELIGLAGEIDPPSTSG